MNEKQVSKLCSIGLIFNGEEFIHKIYKDINVHWTEIACDSKEEFNLKCKKISDYIIRKNNSNEEER
jgi:hypothetical protein